MPRLTPPTLTASGPGPAREFPLPAAWMLLFGGVHVVVVAAMLGGVLTPLFNDATHRLGPGTDLLAYWEAGNAWVAGAGVYGEGVAFGYRYHPLFAMTAGSLLAHLPLNLGFLLWVIGFELLLVLDLVLLRQFVPDHAAYRTLATLLLVFSPYLLELYMGNASFIAASLLLLGFALDARGRRVAFVFVFALSMVVKPLGAVLLPMLLLRGRWKECAAIVAVVAGAAVPYFLGRPEDLRAIVAVNLNREGAGWIVHAGNHGLHGLVASLCTRLAGIPTWKLASFADLPFWARATLMAIPLLVGALAIRATWLVTRMRHPEGLAVGVFLGSAVYLLGFHDVWEHSYSMLVLGLGLMWGTEFVPRRLLLACTVGLALPTAFVFYDVALPPGPYDPEHAWTFGTSLLHHATKPVWILALFGACVVKAERLARAGTRSEVLAIEPQTTVARAA